MYLDQVLKQNGNDAETRIYAGQFFTIIAGSKDISEEERKNNIDKAEEQFNLALESVSYTHLDVYKRQVCNLVAPKARLPSRKLSGIAFKASSVVRITKGTRCV